MSWKPVLLIVLMLISAVGIGMIGTAGADDRWGDSNCWLGSDEGPIVSSGEQSGTIQSPGDQDNFRVQLDHGEYLSIRASADDSIDISMFPNSDNTVQEISDVSVRGGSPGDLRTVHFNADLNTEGTWELWAEDDIIACISIEASDNEPDVPFEWILAIERNDPDPPEFSPADDSLLDEIAELEAENTNLESDIANLESDIASLEAEIGDLEAKNAELEAEIDDLEAELEATEDGDVIIDISVEPADAAEFIAGGEAIIDVDIAEASPEDVEIEFAGNQYITDGGQATVPLDSAGTHEMSFSYEDVEKTVLLDIANDDTDDDSDDTASPDHDAADTTPTDDDEFGSGFGLAVGLIALLGMALLLGRQN